MDDNITKALQIGAAALLMVIIVSAVIVYVTTAQSAVKFAQKQNLSASREELYFDELKKLNSNNNSQISGIDARNIIFQFSGNQDNIVVDYMENGALKVSKINHLRDNLTGQQDILRINNIIQPTDKIEIVDLKLAENNIIYVRLNKINKI